MSLFTALFVSLALTLSLELAFALLWGESVGSLVSVTLANVVSNPIVVLFHHLFQQFLPFLVMPATVILELAAIVGEGWYYRRYTSIRYPWGFSLCANLFSFTVGLLLSSWRSFL